MAVLRAARRRRRAERGSMAVEVVILTPVLLAFVMLSWPAAATSRSRATSRRPPATPCARPRWSATRAAAQAAAYDVVELPRSTRDLACSGATCSAATSSPAAPIRVALRLPVSLRRAGADRPARAASRSTADQHRPASTPTGGPDEPLAADRWPERRGGRDRLHARLRDRAAGLRRAGHRRRHRDQRADEAGRRRRAGRPGRRAGRSTSTALRDRTTWSGSTRPRRGPRRGGYLAGSATATARRRGPRRHGVHRCGSSPRTPCRPRCSG